MFKNTNEYQKRDVFNNTKSMKIKEILGVLTMLNRSYYVLSFLMLAAVANFIGVAKSEDWSSYSPSQFLGSDNKDWWMNYPDQNEKSGSSVKHPDWIRNDLKESPVLILIHSSNCKPCLMQIPRIEKTTKLLEDELKYYDILAEGSGFQEALDILDVYDPIGRIQYVPTTIFVTLMKDSKGEVKLAWHSAIDAMSEEEINGYAKDAVYYYKQNAADWR